ncbi:DUF1499 domain-containing protein [Microvirga arabica]|uniref:DUF1499 domain-containing protein n=1 Tax=Microvirga arabica TaxID=1128671 RepID=UPI0019392A2D|nr:DUF1499 domain-containing protein [Microvirga arabica]MBM1174582.1 DUF1499 domain-containing protein [Microvirga arabica]
MRKKAVAIGLVGISLGYGLWRGWETGIERAWQGVFGSPDLGPVEFAALKRRTNPNDALICPRDICSQAQPDAEPPVFPISGDRLRGLVSDVALAEPGTTLVDRGPQQDRYLVRTRLMRFPDTVVVQVFDRGPDESTLALYSRSQIGRSDFGVNRRRIERWVARIGTLAARQQT